MPCSVLENDETVKGWKAGNSVAYCEPCFREVTEEQQRSNEIIQMNPVKNRSTEARRPRPFSFSVHENKFSAKNNTRKLWNVYG